MRCPPCSHSVDGPLSLRSSRQSSWGPRTQRSTLCCRHRCASSHHLVPGCRRKCCRPLVSLGDHAWSPLLTNRHASWGIVPQQLHRPALWWRWCSCPQWLSIMCQRHRYRLVLWGPQAHPSWTSRNPSIRSCGWSELSRRKQSQLPRPLPLLTSCRSL